MVNGFRYYRALESVSMIASALSIALAIYPCQIRVHQRWQSKLRLPTVSYTQVKKKLKVTFMKKNFVQLLQVFHYYLEVNHLHQFQ